MDNQNEDNRMIEQSGLSPEGLKMVGDLYRKTGPFVTQSLPQILYILGTPPTPTDGIEVELDISDLDPESEEFRDEVDCRLWDCLHDVAMAEVEILLMDNPAAETAGTNAERAKIVNELFDCGVLVSHPRTWSYEDYFGVVSVAFSERGISLAQALRQQEEEEEEELMVLFGM